MLHQAKPSESAVHCSVCNCGDGSQAHQLRALKSEAVLCGLYLVPHALQQLQVRCSFKPNECMCLTHESCYMNLAPAGAEAEERIKAQQMLRMLANRSNSRWVEKVEWEAPFTFDTPRFLKLLGE